MIVGGGRCVLIFFPRQRMSSYPLEDGLNFDGIDAPTPTNGSKTSTKILNEHVVCGYSYVVVGYDGQSQPPRV